MATHRPLLRGRSVASVGRNPLRDVKITPKGSGFRILDSVATAGTGLDFRGLISWRITKTASHPMARHSPAKAKLSPHGRKGRKIVEESFHEVMTNEPSTVERAKVSATRKKKMRIAIALEKARARGVAIPRRAR